MSVRVGRRTYIKGKPVDPKVPGYTPIISLTPYGCIGPYCLRDDQGYFLENRWQGSKVYASVPTCRQTYSRFDRRVIWEHPAEKHAILQPDGTYALTSAYYDWRRKLMANPDPVRYPIFTSSARENWLPKIKTASAVFILCIPLG